MTSFIKCNYEDCNNITTDYQIYYGAYCFKHSKLTYCNASLGNKIYLASSYPRVKTPVRRPLSPKRVSNESAENIKCMLCDTSKSHEYKMKCGHFICEECISSLKTLRCPCCKENMTGPVLTPQIKKMIEQKISENNLKEASQIYKINDNTNEDLEL
jgi:hypothetical protein